MAKVKADKKIRLGLVRCSDIHGYYYGVMIAPCDPMLLLEKYYIVHYYASNIYDPRKLTIPKVDGFDLVNVWDYDIARAKTYAEVFMGKPRVCEKLEDVAEGVDAVFISNGERDGSDHLKLATPFLKRGLPTFVDKPFSSNVKDAQEIVRLAEKHKAPLFNASILSHVPMAECFKKRFCEIDHTYYPVPDDLPIIPVGLGIVKGVGGTFSQELAGKAGGGGLEDRMAYLIHGVSLAINMFGGDVETVEAMGNAPLEYLHLHMKSGREVMIVNTSTKIFPEACSFYASAFSKYGAVHSEPIGDPQFIGGGKRILEIFRDMARTGKAPQAYGEFVRNIAVIEAGVLAQKNRKPVKLAEVWKG